MSYKNIDFKRIGKILNWLIDCAKRYPVRPDKVDASGDAKMVSFRDDNRDRTDKGVEQPHLKDGSGSI